MTDELETKMREKARKLLDNWCGEWRAVHLDKFTEEITQALLGAARESECSYLHAAAELTDARAELAQARAQLEEMTGWRNELGFR